MWTIDFEAGELLVSVAVYIEDRDGAGEFRRRIHEGRGYGNDPADFLGMTGSEQLHCSRSAGKAGKENALSIGLILMKHIVKNRYQIPLVIDG
jgi:hypothetical protein